MVLGNELCRKGFPKKLEQTPIQDQESKADDGHSGKMLWFETFVQKEHSQDDRADRNQ